MSEDRTPRGALEEVELPSGRIVRGLVTPLVELLRFGLVPTDLLEAVLHYADPSWREPDEHDEPVSTEELVRRNTDHVRVLRMLSAEFLRFELVDGEWVRVRAFLADMVPPTNTWDGDDIDAIEDVILRLRTPEMVAADGRLQRAQTALTHALNAFARRETKKTTALRAEIARLAQEAVEVREREAGATVLGLVDFREEPGGAPAGAEGDAPGPVRLEDQPGPPVDAAEDH